MLYLADHRFIVVDDMVEYGVQHIVDPMLQQFGRFFQPLSKVEVSLFDAMADRDDMANAHKDMGFPERHLAIGALDGSRHDKKLVPIDVHLGQLMSLERVLHRERVQGKTRFEERHFFRRRLNQANPDELVVADLNFAQCIRCELLGDHAIPINPCGHNAHGNLRLISISTSLHAAVAGGTSTAKRDDELGRCTRMRKRPSIFVALLPAGVWLLAARAMMATSSRTRRLGLIHPRLALYLSFRAAALYRAGFAAWRYNRGKWR